MLDRFWSKVVKTDTCWNWSACLSNNGYGYFKENGSMVFAHRRMWEMIHGPIPAGKYVLHSCDNKRCINPDHLFLGTKEDNSQDMIKKGRSGLSKLTWEQVEEIRASTLSIAYLQENIKFTSQLSGEYVQSFLGKPAPCASKLGIDNLV